MRIYRGKNLDFDCRFDEYDKSLEVVSNDLAAIEHKEKPSDALLKLIYAIDPLTNLPTGDLQYYVSDSVNPDIKAFVLQNLMFDASSVAQPKAPVGFSDDVAFELMRKTDESIDVYASRVNDYMQRNIEFIKKATDAKPVQSD